MVEEPKSHEWVVVGPASKSFCGISGAWDSSSCEDDDDCCHLHHSE